MLDLSILDTLIAMVIVILVLSLIVQSMQALTKKLFKLKSRSILSSLQDLFETIVPASPSPSPNPAAAKTSSPPTANGTISNKLVKDVTDKLKEMGRKTLLGRTMLDSLAKDDLLKVLTKVTAEDLLPGAVGKFQAVLEGIRTLKNEIDKIEMTLLKGDASAKFAAMQGSVMPLLHDLEALTSGDSLKASVLFGDLYKLRQIKASEVLDVLGEVQQSVGEDLSQAQSDLEVANKELETARAGNNQNVIDAANARNEIAAARLTAVVKVDTGLKEIARMISGLRTAFDAAFAPLFGRLQQVEIWYDTVMQGFEERYARHMKTVAIAISIVVVVLLNANFFSIYRAIKADPVKTSLIVQQGPALLKSVQETSAKPAETPAPTPTPSSTPKPPATTSTDSSTTTVEKEKDESAKTETKESPTTIADVKKQEERVVSLIQTYESFGIKPLSRQQIYDAFTGQYSWRDLNETFVGWAIMVMLLSAGAPFWQDALESLFGLKNVLRQKSGTKNVEEEKGGQPKP